MDLITADGDTLVFVEVKTRSGDLHQDLLETVGRIKWSRVERAALLKYWVTEQQGRVMDECLQLFGGYGYMSEYPIAELYTDARVQRIYGGTNEIMKELAARFM